MISDVSNNSKGRGLLIDELRNWQAGKFLAR